VINDEGKCAASYQASELEKYYRLHELEKYMITSFMEKFHQDYDIKKFLTSWWVEDKRFFGKTDGIYTIINLRDPYMIYLCHRAMVLMCRL
jgi:hypothetical protein